MIYPWQTEQWQQLLRCLRDERLPHAVLLSGPSATGKLKFCLACIWRINCVQPTQDNHACGVCNNCRLLKAGTHPDIRMINVDEEVDQIKVDVIRELNQFISLSRRQGLYKIVCINRADYMNVNAANALLKTLEEPPLNSVLFLVSSRMDTLPATIKSRCQIWRFGLPDERQALNWLQQQASNPDWKDVLAISGNRPLLALKLHSTNLGKSRTRFYGYLNRLMSGGEGVTKLSAKLQDEELGHLVAWQQSWCTDLLRCYYKKNSVTLENPDIHSNLLNLVSQIDLQSLFRYLDRLTELSRFSDAPLNKRLFIEDMLIRCQEILRQPAC